MNKAAQTLGRLGGKVSSEAKTAAARKNGAKGGRPGRKLWQVMKQDGFERYNEADYNAVYKGRRED